MPSCIPFQFHQESANHKKSLRTTSYDVIFTELALRSIVNYMYVCILICILEVLFRMNLPHTSVWWFLGYVQELLLLSVILHHPRNSCKIYVMCFQVSYYQSEVEDLKCMNGIIACVIILNGLKMKMWSQIFGSANNIM